MSQGQNKSTKNKISNEFAARLDQLEPGETVRAIVLLEVKSSEKNGASGRQSRSQRKVAVERKIWCQAKFVRVVPAVTH